MISETDNSFEIRCDWGCAAPPLSDFSAQLVTDAAQQAGWEMQIKRMGDGRQHVFYFCPVHAKRGREFDTEGKRVKKTELK